MSELLVPSTICKKNKVNKVASYKTPKQSLNYDVTLQNSRKLYCTECNLDSEATVKNERPAVRNSIFFYTINQVILAF